MLQVQEQSPAPLTTAHLAQTMSLLALSNLELRERVLDELNENPALELIDDLACPACHRRLSSAGLCPACAAGAEADEPLVFLSAREASRPPPRAQHEDDEEWRHQDPAAPESLAAYVLQQLALELEPADRPVAAYILAGLDDDGFLQDHPALLARACRAPLSQVERVLNLIRKADPPGLATSGPREALLAQLDLIANGDPRAPLARRLLMETFEALGRRDFDEISIRLGASKGEARRAAAYITEALTPYPARTNWGSGRGPSQGDPNVYYSPDVQISRRSENGNASLVVEIFAPMRGLLRVNPLFRASAPEVDEDVSEEWARHVERAALFVKCLQQRGNTMRRMMRALVTMQDAFIQYGDAHLIPLTRAQIAKRLGVHESTISRAVAGKSVALPNGRIIPLARFFDRSLPIRVRIAEMVERENRPLTDEEIADRLRDEGYRVARRTVAKYRAIERIPPARLRQAKAEAYARRGNGKV